MPESGVQWGGVRARRCSDACGSVGEWLIEPIPYQNMQYSHGLEKVSIYEACVNMGERWALGWVVQVLPEGLPRATLS